MQFESIKKFPVLLFADPGIPENVVIQDETASTFLVVWDPPSSGLYESFEVSYDLDTAASFNPIEVVVLPGTDRNYLVAGLTSNTMYRVRLRTVYGLARSNAVASAGTTGKIFIFMQVRPNQG